MIEFNPENPIGDDVIVDPDIIYELYLHLYTMFPYQISRIQDEIEIEHQIDPTNYWVFIIPSDTIPSDFLFDISINRGQKYGWVDSFPYQIVDDEFFHSMNLSAIGSLQMSENMRWIMNRVKDVPSKAASKYLTNLISRDEGLFNIELQGIKYDSLEHHSLIKYFEQISEIVNSAIEPRVLFISKNKQRKSFFLDVYSEWLAISDILNYIDMEYIKKNLWHGKVN